MADHKYHKRNNTNNSYNDKDMAKTREYGELIKYLTGMLSDDDETEEMSYDSNMEYDSDMEYNSDMDYDKSNIVESVEDATDEEGVSEENMEDMDDDERTAYIKKYLSLGRSY